MARFFSKLRKSTLAQGKAKQYVTYALGEIILVVLGILIAVSINGWNENKKQRREESRLLTNFQTDLSRDMSQLEEIIGLSQKYEQQIDSIFAILEQPKEARKRDFLRYQIAVVNENYFSPNNGTFDEATSSGHMTYLRSILLRQKLFEYYNNEAGYKRVDNAAFQFSTQIGTPTLLEEIAITKEGMQGLGHTLSQLPSLDLKALAANTRYLAMLSGKSSIHGNQVAAWKTKLTEAAEIIALLRQASKIQ